MTGELIDLNRRFRPTAEDDARRFHGLFGHDKLSPRGQICSQSVGWSRWQKPATEVHRVRAATSRGRERGKISFIVTVRDVADAGLEGAMPPEMRRALSEWRASPDAECWLFVDTVDETKDQGHRFDGAARRLADAIAGLEERVHIYVSGGSPIGTRRRITVRWTSGCASRSCRLSRGSWCFGRMRPVNCRGGQPGRTVRDTPLRRRNRTGRHSPPFVVTNGPVWSACDGARLDHSLR